MLDDVSSGNVNYSVLEEINEVETHYFLKMNNGLSLIIPKKAIHNTQEFKEILSKLKEQYNLKENIELNWKWK